MTWSNRMPSARAAGAGRSASCVTALAYSSSQASRRDSVHPDAAQEADLADGRADVGRQPGAGREHQDGPGRRGVRSRGHEHDGARCRPSAKTAQPAAYQSEECVLAVETGPYQRSHDARRSAGQRRPMPSTRSSLPGEAVVVRSNRCLASRSDGASALLRGALDDRAPGRGRDRRDREQRRACTSTGFTVASSTTVTAEAQDPAGGREDRHVHVVEGEDLFPQHRQPVQVLGPLLVRDRGDGRLQPRHVRFEGDGDLVPEPPLHPGRHASAAARSPPPRPRAPRPRIAAGQGCARSGPRRAA